MSKNVVENHERQKDFQKRLKVIESQCINATNQIKQGLLKGEAIKMSNKVIMDIYNEIYRLAEESGNCNASKTSLKSQKTGEKVEEQLILFFKKFLNEFIEEIFKKINECSNEKESVLREVSKTYHDYKAYSYWLFKMFYYLDKFAMPTQSTTLCSTSLKLLKDGYFEKSKQIILNTILQFISETRKNSIRLNKQIKQLIELFQVMGSKEVELKYHKETGCYDYVCLKQDDALAYYNKEFQIHLLQQTQTYYKTEISEKCTFTTPEFVNWGNQIFELEQQMAKDCYPKSELPIENKLKLLFVKEQAQQLVTQGTGVSFMLQSDRIAELKSLYDYIKRTKDCISFIAKAYQSHFEQEGHIINSTDFESQAGRQEGRQINVAELYFAKMLEIMEKAQSILKHQFSEDPEIQKSYNGAFSLVLNKNDKTPLWLAIYTDIIIRSEKGVNEMEMDKKMGKIVQLFQLLYQRDVFFRHYQKFLQMRLLNSQNQNLQQEKQLLQKFKGETGTNVLSQLSSMINDIEQANRFATDYSISQGNPFDFNVYLLSQGCWPLNSILDSIARPPQIQNALDNYEKMYSAKHTGRIVTWCFNLGQGELIYRLPNDKYYLSVNTLQIVSFLQFNQADALTIGNLLENIKIDRVELENTLIPFVCLKLIQRQKPDLEDFSDENEVLKLNFTFSNKAKRMRMLPNPKMQPKRQIKKQEINAEEQQQQEQINKQREFVVDSQLVRLMKSRKTIKHHELLDSCQQMITIFRPDVLFIKKRIENLIEREYIKRDDKDWNIYHYLN